MSFGILGKKIGMTRIFNSESGSMIPVTVIAVNGNSIVQRKTLENDGYQAIQVGFGEIKEKNLSKALLKHFGKYSSAPKRFLEEFRFNPKEKLPDLKDNHIKAEDVFELGQYVDVIAKTKGKGFQGVVKRWNFGGLPQSHGSMMHRRTGGVGAGTTPGRIWKNKKMPGRHGNYRRTIQNLKVVEILKEEQIILVSGSIPGAKGEAYLVIRPAKKRVKQNS